MADLVSRGPVLRPVVYGDQPCAAELALLAHMAGRLLALGPEDDVYLKLAGLFSDLLRGQPVFVCSYDAANHLLVIEATAGLGETAIQVGSLQGLGLPLAPQMQAVLLDTPLLQCDMSLSDWANGDLRPVFDDLQRLVAPQALWVMGAGWQGVLHAGIVVLARREAAPPSPALMAVGARQITLALKHHITEHSLRYNEERYRRLAEFAPDIIYRYRLQPDLAFEYISAALTRISGYTPEEFYADPQLMFRLVHPPDLEALRKAYVRTVFDGPLYFRWICKDGSMVWIEHRSTPISDETGMIVAIEGIARDVTAAMRRKRELEAIASLSAALRVAAGPVDMPPIVLAQLAEQIQPQAAMLILYHAEEMNLFVEAATGEWHGRRGWHLSRENGLVGGVYLQGNTHHARLNLATRLADNWILPADPGKWLAIVPLPAQQQPLGVLVVLRNTPLAEEEMSMLRITADITANAVQRSGLHEKTERRMQRLAILQKINLAINSSLDMNRTIRALFDQLKKSGFDSAALLLFDPQTQTLTYKAAEGFSRPYPPHVETIDLGEGLAGQVARDGRLTYVPDLQQEALGDLELNRQDFGGYSSYLAAPLLSQGNLQGVLEIYQLSGPRLDSEGLAFIETLALQFGLALENARLYTELQRQVSLRSSG